HDAATPRRVVPPIHGGAHVGVRPPSARGRGRACVGRSATLIFPERPTLPRAERASTRRPQRPELQLDRFERLQAHHLVFAHLHHVTIATPIERIDQASVRLEGSLRRPAAARSAHSVGNGSPAPGSPTVGIFCANNHGHSPASKYGLAHSTSTCPVFAYLVIQAQPPCEVKCATAWSVSSSLLTLSSAPVNAHTGTLLAAKTSRS